MHYPVAESKHSCRFCKQNVPVISGEYFEEFTRSVKEFDPFTFWELVGQREAFYRLGHWPSDRTPNHYHFRIMADPIFRWYGYDLAVRLRNVLRQKNILPAWIDKIVCTDGEESITLATELAFVIGLQPSDVIRIPRAFFLSIVGKELNPELAQHVSSEYGEEAMQGHNVIIVDQAAHHFKTLSSLRDVCEYYDCTVLAFAVFVDRTDAGFSLGEYLPNSHYVSLYSWPVPPRRGYECPCSSEG